MNGLQLGWIDFSKEQRNKVIIFMIYLAGLI